MFRFEQLRYYVTTVDKGSLNKAAKALYISQPALTKQLAQLERQVNCVLFYRQMKGIELTEAGRYFYEKASLILEQINQTMEGIQQYANQSPLRIGALPSAASYYLPDVSTRYTEETGEKVITTVFDTTDELITMLLQGALDIAVGQNFAGHPELCSRTLFDDPYVAVLPVSHPLASLHTVDFIELCGEKMVLHKDPCDIRKDFRRHCTRLGLQPELISEHDFNESLLLYAAKGYGVTVVPQMVAEHVRDPLLAVKPINTVPFFRTIDVIYHVNPAREVEELLKAFD